jgi:hypothetical protein
MQLLVHDLLQFRQIDNGYDWAEMLVFGVVFFARLKYYHIITVSHLKWYITLATAERLTSLWSFELFR